MQSCENDVEGAQFFAHTQQQSSGGDGGNIFLFSHTAGFLQTVCQPFIYKADCMLLLLLLLLPFLLFPTQIFDDNFLFTKEVQKARNFMGAFS